MVRYKYIYLFLTLILLSCSNSTTSISGNLNVPSLTYLYISEVDLEHKTTKLLDSIQIKPNQRFHKNIELIPGIYELEFKKDKSRIAVNYNQKLELSERKNQLIITGSYDTDLLNKYERFRKESLNRLVNSVRNQIKNLPQDSSYDSIVITLRELEVENYKKHLNELTDFIDQNLRNSIALYATTIRWSNTDRISDYKNIVHEFEQSYPNLAITKKLKNKVSILSKSKIGNQISNIILPNENGENINLLNLNNRIVLIDFWASWCPPCRTEAKLLKELYQKYKEQGFEIYSISLDKSKKRWLSAIAKDSRNWINVSSLKGFNTKVAIDYNITSLPTNYIIDSEGKILYKDIHGEYLKKKIENLLER